jgi:hypothetical protein
VIARRVIPERYWNWNRRHGAPAGRRGAQRLNRLLGDRSTLALRYTGEYAYQSNNDTRTFEYPYAFEKVVEYTRPGDQVLEIGGGVSGLQFTLSRTGRVVVNVDPGPTRGWDLDTDLHQRIGATLKTPVRLHTDVLSTYEHDGGAPNLVYSVSALEHFSPSDLAEGCAALRKLLAPGGTVVLTVDLFLDLSPFTSRARSDTGTNIDLSRFLSEAGLVLIEGEPAELHGFPEFSSEDILCRLHEFHVGRPFPTLTQCLVAQRSADEN